MAFTKDLSINSILASNEYNDIRHRKLRYLLKLIELFLQDFHMFKVLPELLRRYERLLVVDPEHDLITLPHKLYQVQRLLQLQALLSQLGQQ